MFLIQIRSAQANLPCASDLPG